MMRGTRAEEAVLAVFQDLDGHVRQAVVKGLPSIANPRAKNLLMEALKDGDADVRKMSAETLMHHPDPLTVKALFAALRDKNYAVCRDAAKFWANCTRCGL